MLALTACEAAFALVMVEQPALPPLPPVSVQTRPAVTSSSAFFVHTASSTLLADEAAAIFPAETEGDLDAAAAASSYEADAATVPTTTKPSKKQLLPAARLASALSQVQAGTKGTLEQSTGTIGKSLQMVQADASAT